MAENPSYVKLRYGVDMQADLDNDWSITGNDVKEFPKDSPAEDFVRQKLALGVLEAATKAEFEDAKEGDAELPQPVLVGGGVTVFHQEAKIQADAAKARSKREAKRAKEAEGAAEDLSEARQEEEEARAKAEEAARERQELEAKAAGNKK